MLHIYVDGSCIGNQNVDEETPAGWGVVVIAGSKNLGRGDGEIIHEFHGRVITDEAESGFIGAEVGSNNTAELTAIAEALRWLLLEGGNEEIIIKTDSKYAGNRTAESTFSTEMHPNRESFVSCGKSRQNAGTTKESQKSTF